MSIARFRPTDIKNVIQYVLVISPTNGAGGGRTARCEHYSARPMALSKETQERARGNERVSPSFSGSLTLVRRIPRNGGDSRRAYNAWWKRAYNEYILYTVHPYWRKLFLRFLPSILVHTRLGVNPASQFLLNLTRALASNLLSEEGHKWKPTTLRGPQY